jgi:hypothetical protein
MQEIYEWAKKSGYEVHVYYGRFNDRRVTLHPNHGDWNTARSLGGQFLCRAPSGAGELVLKIGAETGTVRLVQGELPHGASPLPAHVA